MCSYTPRFSYGTSETAVSAPAWTSAGALTVRARWVYQGGCTGVGIQGGYTRVGVPGEYPAIPSPPADQRPEGAGPACRAGWVGSRVGVQLGTVFGGGDGPSTPLRGPVGPGRPSLAGTLQMPPLGNKARLTSYFYKVSQNGRVSPEYVEKACHSPYLQNGPVKSPLEILRFPILPAFSRKELMGLF